MLIREYTPADLDALRRMHSSQGFDYAFPDIADPIFVSKLVVEDDGGRAVMASLARLTCEMYLLVDREDNSSLSSRGPSLAEGSLFGAATCNPDTQREIPRPPRRTRNDKPDTRGRAGNARARWAQFLALHVAGERDLARTRPRRRARMAPAADRAPLRTPPRIARLGPRHRVDAVLQKIETRRLAARAVRFHPAPRARRLNRICNRDGIRPSIPVPSGTIPKSSETIPLPTPVGVRYI